MGKIALPNTDYSTQGVETTTHARPDLGDGGFVTKGDAETVSAGPQENQGDQEGNKEYERFIELLPLKKALGINLEDTTRDPQLLFIKSWATERFGEGEKMIGGIRRTLSKLGEGTLGESKVIELYNYVKITNEFTTLKKMKEVMEGK